METSTAVLGLASQYECAAKTAMYMGRGATLVNKCEFKERFLSASLGKACSQEVAGEKAAEG
jgi:hypothetical protein